MEYVITASSTADLPREYLKKRNIPVIEYTFVINDKEYKDDLGVSMGQKEFYDTVRKGALPTTSQVNAEKYTAFWEPFLKEGKDVLHATLSSGITGSYNSARMAAEELRSKYPERKLYLVDSLSASLGFGLLMHYALNLRDEGRSIDEVYAWMEENKLKVNHWFTVDDLFHLKRGGRVSGATAVIGTILHIKPVLNIDNEGHLIPREKPRGRKQALAMLLSKMEELIENPDGQDIFISHGDSEEDAKVLAGMVKERFPGIKSIMIDMIGPVVGAHSGPGTIALFFLGKHR
jgi:DegV family protein with EDD domain